jgi:hypothetical protein
MTTDIGRPPRAHDSPPERRCEAQPDHAAPRNTAAEARITVRGPPHLLAKPGRQARRGVAGAGRPDAGKLRRPHLSLDRGKGLGRQRRIALGRDDVVPTQAGRRHALVEHGERLGAGRIERVAEQHQASCRGGRQLVARDFERRHRCPFGCAGERRLKALAIFLDQ